MAIILGLETEALDFPFLPPPPFLHLFLLLSKFRSLFSEKTRGSVSIGGVLEVTFRPSVRKVRFPLHIRLAA